MKNKKGFTLIELLAVILLVAVVASISVYTIFSVIENARKKTYQVTIKNIEGNAESYIGENDDKDFIDIGGGKESQCVTVKDLVDYGYLDNKVIKAKVDKDTTVSLSDKVYIEREASTKTVTKSVYVGKTDKNNICPLGNAYIIFTPTEEELKPTHEQKVKIAYYIDNRLVNDFDKYKCTYEYVPKDTANATLKGESEAIQELTLTYNGKLHANIYLRGKEATEDEEGTEDDNIAHEELPVDNIDNEAPAIMIDAESKLKSTTQEVTLTCEDEVTKVVGYYYGLTEPTSETKYKSVAKQQGVKIKQIIDYQHPGTYYFSCEDEAGNRTEPQAVTFYNYIVENRLETVSGTQGIYDTTNYELISKATYIAKEGTVLTLSGIYTIPTGSNANHLEGVTIDGGTTPSMTSPTLSANNKTYTLWFTRNVLYIRYKPGDSGTLVETTKNSSKTETYTWKLNADGEITRSINGGAATNNLQSYRYGTTTIDLLNYNNSNYLNITRSGYSGKGGAQWICTSGCNITLNQNAISNYNLANLCSNIANQDCTITVSVNWVKNQPSVPASEPCYYSSCGFGGGGGGGGGYKPCFLAGTKVVTVNGYKDIDRIAIGDLVLTYNEGTGNNEYQAVKSILFHSKNDTDDELRTLYFDDLSSLKVTGSHVFYVLYRGKIELKPARDLKAGSIVVTSEKKYLKIASIETSKLVEDTYNIETEKNHNYYVSEHKILVHNTKPFGA